MEQLPYSTLVPGEVAHSDTSHFYFRVVTFVLDTSLRQSRETKFVDFLL